MIKRVLLVILILSICVAFASCSGKKVSKEILLDNWNGQYIWEDEETEEFKLINIQNIDEESIKIVCKSARKTEEFETLVKSSSKRYAAVNLGSKSLKINLSSKYDYVDIDDMWTDENLQGRIENWSGRYRKLEEGEDIPEFGNPAWNGRYVCEENGQTMSVYGIKDRYVLFTYETTDGEDKVINKLECLESDPKRAVYTKDERLVMLDILEANKRISITDMYMDDMENAGISGIYKKIVTEGTNGQ